jgi:hypothetical protein
VEAPGIESEANGRRGPPRAAFAAPRQVGSRRQKALEDDPKPKPASSDEAILAAIKLALDERAYDRAAALLGVLLRPFSGEPPRQIVVPLRKVPR